MKLYTKTKLTLPGVIVVLVASVAEAGGLAEPVPEPRVVVPDESVEHVVRPAKPAKQDDCRRVTVSVTTDAPQWFGNQGLLVSGCCCGAIAIPGTSFVLQGQSSSRQELVCDGEGNS